MSTDTEARPIVEMRGITIEFPGVKALDGVDVTLRGGEVHTLMGENGAGKSTLIKALTGVYAIDGGTIVVDGAPRDFRGTADAQLAGISTVYQEVNLCTNLSVGENVMLGHEVRGPLGIDWRATHREAARHLANLGLRLDTRSLLAAHSIAVQQLVAISRAMVTDSRVLVLDEPTSSLDRGEVEQLFGVIRDLRDRGVAILFVTHFLDQVYEISDRLTVLRNGKLVGEYPVAELPRGELISKMIGRELDELDAISRSADRDIDRAGEPVIRAEGIARRGVIEPADVDVYDGEVVGIAGLLGSGRTELVRLLYGADRADAGRVQVRGRAARIATPRHAIDRRIAFSSEDRRAEGIIGDLTVAENIVLGIQAKRGALRKLRRAEQDAIVDEYIRALGVRPANPHALVRNLSGGNQQKVLLARWLATAPQLIILDEPTRGIDVGAKADIQRKVAELSEQGLAVVFISSELEEVIRIAQRIVVMRDRRKIGELTSHDIGVDDLVAFIADEQSPPDSQPESPESAA
ncbi:MAG: sugar ABC transporter ATP-binding protein [Micrococcales bacterium]|nr:sugar ABC transporter ATP-binding protein [Micrococcales bacterium]OJX69658.1 MAG: sugar ABC transporter ATP-binding protein [Micrococcales bacterium 72-143]